MRRQMVRFVLVYVFIQELNILLFSPVCDSYVRPETLVRICDECNFGTYGGRCIICGSPGTFRAVGGSGWNMLTHYDRYFGRLLLR